MHELDADRTAVGLPQDGDHLAQSGRAPLLAAQPIEEDPVQVRFGQPECRGFEQFMRLASRAELERVEIGQVMAVLAVGVDQPRDGRLRPGRVEVYRSAAARGRTATLIP